MNASIGATTCPHPHPPAPRLGLLVRPLLVALGLLLLAVLSPVLMAQAQATEPTVTLDPPSATAGAIVLVNGEGFSPGGEILTFFWNGVKVGTHPMDAGDSFSIPFPVPDDANPGDHHIDVCFGDPCSTQETSPKAGALFRVSGAMPPYFGNLAYVYDTDKELAGEFAALLGKAGFNVTLIELADLARTDLGGFRAVLVGGDTGGGDNWGTPDQVKALNTASRIIGIGKGGHAFLGKLDLMIGAPNGSQALAQTIDSADSRLTSLRIPYDMTTLVRNRRAIPLFSEPANAIGIDLTNQATELVPHALMTNPQDPKTVFGAVVSQGCRTLWGFDANPKAMGPLGQAFFVNVVVFALGNSCDISRTAPCSQLVNQNAVPGFAHIDFDDMENGREIGDFYANSYGVRFEKSATNHAIIYGGHPNDPSQPRSAPNTASNSAIFPATSESVPMSIFFDQDRSHGGMWIGNGENGAGEPANLTAKLTAFDRAGKELCSTEVSPVPVSHTAFIGLTDAFGRIARLELDYGRTFNSESIDNLIFGPFFPPNNIRVCHLHETACTPAANAQVVILRNGQPAGAPVKTNSQGYVTPRSRVHMGDALWAFLPVSTTTRTTLHHTNGAPDLVLAASFNRFPAGEMEVQVGPTHPLLLYNLIVSTQWSMIGDAAYQNRLRSHIQKAAHYFYDFTDGQMGLRSVQVYQNYDKWDEADVRIYASNSFRPSAEIGGFSTVDTPDPLIPSISYYPGHTFMGRTWNRFNLPGEPTDLGVDVSNDWPLALAHELGHYLLYLFDTYLFVTADGEIVEGDGCTGSAMGWVYQAANTEFIFDNTHWESACGDTLANHTLKRNEWDTILLWYSSLVKPTAVNPGPAAPPISMTDITIHPPSDPALVLPNQHFTLTYQAGETASAEARAFLFRGNRIIDQGKPAEGTTEITLIGAQTDDRFCIFDVNDFTEDAAEPRHQYGCEVLALGDNELQMEKDDNWAPVIEISHATSRTIGISVTQEISAGLSLRAVLYPEDTDTPTEIVLNGGDGFYTGTFNSPVDATSAYVQLYVDEAATETDPRRETLVDFGVGGTGAEGPAHWFGGVPVISSDGKAEFARRTDVFLKRGEFIALQSMTGTPKPPTGRQIVGQAYRLVALPHNLADEGHVSLRLRLPRTEARSAAQTLPEVVIAYWNGRVWRAVKSVNLDDLIDGRIAVAPTQGVGVYALLLGTETQGNQLFLPQITR